MGGKTQYEALNAAPASNKNQLNGYCHDSSGNLILNAGCPTGSFVATYSYDAENRIVSNPGATYVYDGDGNRVKKVGSTTTLYWYGATGDILTETDLSGGTVNDYVFFGGKRLVAASNKEIFAGSPSARKISRSASARLNCFRDQSFP